MNLNKMSVMTNFYSKIFIGFTKPYIGTNEFPDCHLVLKYFLDIKYIKTFFTPPNTVALIRIQNFCWL